MDVTVRHAAAGPLKQSDIGIAVTENNNNFTPACDAILEAGAFGKLPEFFRFAIARTVICPSDPVTVPTTRPASMATPNAFSFVGLKSFSMAKRIGLAMVGLTILT